MELIPAIDLRNGRVVRLQQGDFERETGYGDNPLELARSYRQQGALSLHLVDLDGARAGFSDASPNLELIEAIAGDADMEIQTGGGVRLPADIQRRLRAGARRVVVGSVCVEQPDRFIHWLDRFGPNALVAALDVRRNEDGRWLPATRGWLDQAEEDLFDLLDRLTNAGLKHLLCTDIARDGMLGGSNTSLYEELAERYPALLIQASGGIGGLEHIAALGGLGVSGVIVGRALLEGRFTVTEALAVCA